MTAWTSNHQCQRRKPPTLPPGLPSRHTSEVQRQQVRWKGSKRHRQQEADQGQTRVHQPDAEEAAGALTGVRGLPGGELAAAEIS